MTIKYPVNYINTFIKRCSMHTILLLLSMIFINSVKIFSFKIFYK